MQTSFQFVKKYYFNFYASCGSTHKIEFAKQIHKKSERVPDFLYKGRKNVPVGAPSIRKMPQGGFCNSI